MMEQVQNIPLAAPLDRLLITGTFVQLDHWDDKEGLYFSEDMRKLTGDDWRRMLHDMAEIGIDTLIFQQSIDARNGRNDLRSYYKSAYFPIVDFLKGREFLYREIIEEADVLNMKVYHALYGMPPGMPDPYLEKEKCLEYARIVTGELSEQFSDTKSFRGWYWTFEYPPCSVAGRDSLRDIVAAVRKIAPGDFMIAPNADRMFGAATLQDIDVDVIAYQDSVGMAESLGAYRYRRGSSHRNLVSLPYIYEQIKFAHDGWLPDNGIKVTGDHCWNFYRRSKRTAFWNDLEIWDIDINNALVPARMSRIMSQLALSAPFVDKQIMYQYVGLMHNPKHPVRIGGNAAAHLYEAYQEYRSRILAGERLTTYNCL